MKVYGVTVYSPRAADAVGAPSHVRQVRAVAQARSKAAFARALVAADLVKGSTASVLRDATETKNAAEVAACVTPDQVFIAPLDRSGLIPWPPAT